MKSDSSPVKTGWGFLGPKICECGFEMDRDIKSAICIRDYSLRNSGQTVPLEQNVLSFIPQIFLGK